MVRIGGVGDHGDVLTVPVGDRGVDVEKISQVPFDAPHRFARQFVVVGLALLSGLGGWFFRWNRKD